MMDKRGIQLIIGFLFLLHGTLALVLMLVGIRLSYLAWIDSWGAVIGLVIRFVFIIGGIVVMYLASNRSGN